MLEKKLFKVHRSLIHGAGVFAATHIPRETRIIEYTGEKITKAEADRRNRCRQKVFLFTLNKRYDIDGSLSSNTTRFINHSCEPNCYAAIDRGHVWIYAKRAISPGEELTYDYGYALKDDWQDYPCLCKSENCQGYIVSRRSWAYLKKRRLTAAAA